MNHYDNLKPRLARAEQLDIFHGSSGQLWKSEWAILGKKLNNAIISKECNLACSCDAQTPSTSPSRNAFTKKKAHQWQRAHSIEERYVIKWRFRLDWEVKFFFRQLYIFSIPSCLRSFSAKRSTISCNVCEDLNEVSSGKEFVRNWRGQCFGGKVFRHLHNARIYSLVEREAPLLSYQGVELYNQNVNGVYVPVCPFQKFFKKFLFSIADRHLESFIRNRITAIADDEMQLGIPSEDIPNTISVVMSFSFVAEY